MGLYGKNIEIAAGNKRAVANQTFVVCVRSKYVGTIQINAARMTLTKPNRSEITPPTKVITAPSVNRIESAVVPCVAEVCSTVIQ